MPRERQYTAFVIDVHELERHLKLPRDHRIVRIEPAQPHHPPGILVVVEGICAQSCPKGASVWCHYEYERWRDQEVDFIREDAIKQLGPYEW